MPGPLAGGHVKKGFTGNIEVAGGESPRDSQSVAILGYLKNSGF